MLFSPALSHPTTVLFILSFFLFVCVRDDNLEQCDDSNHELKVNTSYLQCIILRFYENDFDKHSNVGIISKQFISLEKEVCHPFKAHTQSKGNNGQYMSEYKSILMKKKREMNQS